VRQLFTSPTLALETLKELLKNREQWFSIGGGLFAFAVLLSLVGIVGFARIAGRKLSKWLTSRSRRRSQRNRRIVDFYERFAKLMQTRGLKREPTQTPQEFADHIATAHLPEMSARDLANIPQQISQFFYRVRFGDENLSPDELHQLEASLLKLEQAFSSASH